jgi:hypothetical protein
MTCYFVEIYQIVTFALCRMYTICYAIYACFNYKYAVFCLRSSTHAPRTRIISLQIYYALMANFFTQAVWHLWNCPLFRHSDDPMVK